MNLQQLRSLCEIVDRGLRISDAAKAVYRSQPSVTRQLQELEGELGFAIFVRSRNKILAVTPQGREVVSMTIATTHTQARYSLPGIIRRFIEKYPKVKLTLLQGTPSRCCELVTLGQADLAICSEAIEHSHNLTGLSCYRLTRCVVTPARHPLTRAKTLTLEALASHPLITCDEAFAGRQIVDRTFAARGLKPNIVLSAVDADVSKIYVRMGLGIAIFASIVYDATQDKDLRAIDARHLFPDNTLNIFMRRRSYLRSYMFDLISMFAPHVKRDRIHEALLGQGKALEPGMAVPEMRPGGAANTVRPQLATRTAQPVRQYARSAS
jgi:LysR family cys regulon transcriptional activator